MPCFEDREQLEPEEREADGDAAASVPMSTDSVGGYQDVTFVAL